MHWKVSGADASTGKDVEIELDADTEADVLRSARERGVLVAGLKRKASPPPAPDSAPMEPPPPPAAQQSTAPTAPIDYRGPKSIHPSVEC